MTDVFSIFNNGHLHWREQRDLEKTLVVEQKKGGAGPQPLDLDSGTVDLVIPRQDDARSD